VALFLSWEIKPQKYLLVQMQCPKVEVPVPMANYQPNDSSNPRFPRPGLTCGCCTLSLNAWVNYVRETSVANEVLGHVSSLGDRISRRNLIQSGAFLAGAVATFGSKSFAQAQPTPTRIASGTTIPGADATTVFVNGTILTVDSKFSVVEAMAIRGNQILAVGTKKDVRRRVGGHLRSRLATEL